MKKQWYTIVTIARVYTKAYFRNRTAIFFTVIFPIVFLFIFGSLFGKNNSVSFRVVLINQSNTSFSRTIDQQLSTNKLLKVDKSMTSFNDAKIKMDRGQLDSVIVLPSDFGVAHNTPYPTGTANIYYNQNNQQAAQTLSTVLGGIFDTINQQFSHYTPPLQVTTKSTDTNGATGFDYVFAGMLGFTIIGIGIFGPSTAFPEMKKQGALRRIRTTPVTAVQFIVGNVLSYMLIGALSIAILFIVSKLVFHLDMTGNYLVFAVFAMLGIITIFGFGMAIGGWAANEQQAAPLSNIVAFPLMFLSGTFFPVYLMPMWLQKVSSYLPLTPIIDGLRYIVTENKGFLQLGPQFAIIGVWLVIIYAITFKLFRWE